MADRFPLILNTSANQIQEIASGDTLDLTNNNIANAGIITASIFSGPIVAGAGTSNITAGIITAVAADIDDFIDVGSNIQLGNAGVITATTFKGNGDFVELDVDGHTNLDNVSVAGVTTFASTVNGTTFNATTFAGNGDFVELDVDGHTNLDNVSVAGVTTFASNVFLGDDDNLYLGASNDLRIYHAAGAASHINAVGLVNIDGTTGVRLEYNNASRVNCTSTGVTIGGDLDVDAHTNLDNVSISGVTTHSDNVHIIDDKTLIFGTNSDATIEYDENGNDQLTIAGAVTRFTNTTQSTTKDTGSVILEGGLGVEKNLSVGGNLSVAGVLTYEDVTNVDAVGLVTARTGVRVNSGGIKVTSGVSYFNANIVGTATTAISITATDESSDTTCNVLFATAATGNLAPKTGTNLTFNSSSGALTATSFAGDGSALTGITQTTINSNTNNYLITGTGTANTLQGEANLTFTDYLQIARSPSGGGGVGLILNDTGSSGANEGLTIQWQSGSDKQSDQCRIGQYSNASGSGSNLDFYTNSGDTGVSTRRLRISETGNLVTGNVGSPTSSDQGNIYIKPGSTIGSAGVGGLNIGANAVFNSSWKAIATGATGIITIDNSGGLQYRTDNSTTAGANFSLERRFAISEQGKTLLANDTTVSGNASLAGALSRVQITGPATINSFTLANSYLHIGGTESYSSPGMLQTISFGHIKTTGTYAPAYVGLKTIDRSGHENGQIEIATRNVTTDTVPTPSLIVRPSKSIVKRGPSYGIWTETVQTPNGGSQPTQFIEDCYGQWLCVAKIHNVQAMQGNMSSTRTINVTTADATTTEWSANWGDTNPSAVRYISASDWDYWRETRVLDWMVGIPHDRLWKQYYTSGQSSGMPQVASKYGWTNAGAWDGFGRWRNPGFTNWRMSDNMGGVSIADTFFTTAGQTMNLYGSATDAKFGAHSTDSTAGQDDHVSVGYGWDDGNFGRIDNFPATNNTDMSGTDKTEYGLWIFLSMDGQKHP